MVKQITTDYSIDELFNLQKNAPDRYSLLCSIVGEYALGIRDVNLSIVLPHKDDIGCVGVFGRHKNSEITLLGMRHF